MSFVSREAKVATACRQSGYKGRMGIHELLVATDDVKRLIHPVRQFQKY